jgi:divalent metal cation (Fe/Co/Zn/Cd) transporter
MEQLAAILLSIFLLVVGYLILTESMITLLAYFCLGICIVLFSQFLVSWYYRRQRNDSVD